LRERERERERGNEMGLSWQKYDESFVRKMDHDQKQVCTGKMVRQEQRRVHNSN
jgi:hypothetical protein